MVNRVTWIASIIYFILQTLGVNSQEVPLYYGKHSTNEILHQVYGGSLNSCQHQCIKYGKTCIGISYKRYYRLCILYRSTRLSDKLNLEDDPDSVYSHANDWNMDVSCSGRTCSDGQTCELIDGEDNCQTTYCPSENLAYGYIEGNMNYVGARRRYICHGGAIRGSIESGIVQCHSNATWTTFKCLPFRQPLFNVIFKSTNPIVEFNNISKQECANKCFNGGMKCTIFNYYKSNAKCEHMSFYSNSPENHIQALSVRKIFPVIILVNRNQSAAVKFTYEHSRELCKSRGHDIASMYDMQLAYSVGYSTCRCGYISDGQIVQPVTDANKEVTGCTSTIGLNICSKSAAATVYCKHMLFVDNGIFPDDLAN